MGKQTQVYLCANCHAEEHWGGPGGPVVPG